MPFSAERTAEIQALIRSRIKRQNLNDWERSFLSSMDAKFAKDGTRTSLSKAQYAKLHKIMELEREITKAPSRVKARFHSVSATLAWMTPVNAGRQSYRAVRLKMNEPANLGALAISGNSTQPDQHQMNRGTVSTRHWSGDHTAIVGESDELTFEVSRMPDDDGRVSFAIAVTLRMPGVTEIYDQARALVYPELRARS